MKLLPMSPVRLLPMSPVYTKGGLGGFYLLRHRKKVVQISTPDHRPVRQEIQ